MKLTIHQPNFFPWYPFFQKLQSADMFVFLNHAQFQKNYLQNRFSFNQNWYTLSVNKGLDPIITKKFINPLRDWKSIKNKLPDYKEVLSFFDDCISENVSDTNSKIISKICVLLKIDTKLINDYYTDLRGTDRLVDICLNLGATTYISGISGKNYLEIDKFKDKNIDVIFQKEEDMIKTPIIEIIKNKL